MVHKISEKKKYGVFYTPRRVADILCNWAIKSAGVKVLEPSFGGCDFLEASRERFVTLGDSQTQAESQIYGCDIDPYAFDVLQSTFTNPNGHFKKDDFLKLTLDSFPIDSDGFEVVIGNPPYVSHHNMGKGQKESAFKSLQTQNLVIGGRASLWAYFVLHSISFLKTGGRMAWILPSSFLYADYAEKVQDVLTSKFKRCLFVNIHERLFLGDGTEEISIVALCDGFTKDTSSADVQRVSVSNVSELESVIQKWGRDEITVTSVSDIKLSISKGMQFYQNLLSHESTKKLGDLFDVQIGIVSGANNFFILNEQQWSENKLPLKNQSFIVSKFRFAKGLSLNPSDIDTIKKLGAPCLLVDTAKSKIVSKNLDVYLGKFPKDKIENMATFTRRKNSGVWHRFNDNRIPDAFFPYMHNKGVWIVLNKAKVNSTNSIHRLYKKTNVTNDYLKLAAISILSTFSQVSSEIEGRTYGAGVLKHEPSETVNIRILLPNVGKKEVNKTFQEIDSLLRNGFFEKARKTADRMLLKEYSEDIRKEYSCLSEELMQLQNKRVPLKKSR